MTWQDLTSIERTPGSDGAMARTTAIQLGQRIVLSGSRVSIVWPLRHVKGPYPTQRCVRGIILTIEGEVDRLKLAMKILD